MALILAASQDFEVSHGLAQVLVRLRHSVVATSSASHAMKWLEEAATIPQLIIADVGFKAFGGLEFIQALKQSTKLKQIPVLVQTKSWSCDFHEYCEGALRKPWSPSDLGKAVELILSRQGPGLKINS